MASKPDELRITWDRVRSIFGSPPPPRTVTEKQFDGFDDHLARMAKTPWEAFDFSDLRYYHHDLAFVDLQPGLFARLFPVCLMDWHDTLMRNASCSHGDSEFHSSLRRGNVLEKMLAPRQRTQVFEFFRDGFLDRLDRERGFACLGPQAPVHGWMRRLNSLGRVMPDLGAVWEAWWALDSPGSAVAWLEYASGLIYDEGENFLFRDRTCEGGGGGPYLWENDSNIYDAGWRSENLEDLRRRLTPDAVASLVHRAATRLRGEAESDVAARIEGDLLARTARVAARCAELPRLLAHEGFVDGWSW